MSVCNRTLVHDTSTSVRCYEVQSVELHGIDGCDTRTRRSWDSTPAFDGSLDVLCQTGYRETSCAAQLNVSGACHAILTRSVQLPQLYAPFGTFPDALCRTRAPFVRWCVVASLPSCMTNLSEVSPLPRALCVCLMYWRDLKLGAIHPPC